MRESLFWSKQLRERKKFTDPFMNLRLLSTRIVVCPTKVSLDLRKIGVEDRDGLVITNFKRAIFLFGNEL